MITYKILIREKDGHVEVGIESSAKNNTATRAEVCYARALDVGVKTIMDIVCLTRFGTLEGSESNMNNQKALNLLEQIKKEDA